MPLHRHVYTTATVVLAATAAHEVVTGAGGLPSDPADVAGALGVVAAVLAYVVVNTVLIAVAIGLSRHATDARELMGRWDDNALEIATLCLGGLAAVALGGAPFLVALALPPILVLHRAVRVRHLEEAASLDGKTGLLNAATWRPAPTARSDARGRAAVRACSSSTSTTSRTVNDQHGHLAGDDVLAAVAGALRSAVRGQDLVGRFGGEEFVVLVGGLPRGRAGRVELAAVGERLRSQVAGLCVPALGRRRDRRAHGVGGRAACVGPGEELRRGRCARPTPACTRPNAAGATGCASRGREPSTVPAPRAAGDALRRVDEPSRRSSVSWSA